jgi:hypothetical protein
MSKADLVKQLRDHNRSFNCVSEEGEDCWRCEAAGEIERLRRDDKRLRGDLHRKLGNQIGPEIFKAKHLLCSSCTGKGTGLVCSNCSNDSDQEAMDEHVKNARLWKALEKIKKIPTKPFPDRGAHSERVFADATWTAWSRIQVIARTALHPEPHEAPADPTTCDHRFKPVPPDLCCKRCGLWRAVVLPRDL